MTIIAPKPTLTLEDLPQKVTDITPEALEQLSTAVLASAVMHEPLAFLLGDSERRTAQLHHSQALDWLICNAKIDPSTLSGRASSQASVEHYMWLHIIDTLAQRLIAANYLQGWRDDAHPAFQLEYVPLDPANQNERQPYPIQKEHWALFVQGVMLKHWLETAESSTGKARSRAISQCRAFLGGVATELARHYYKLGKLGDGSRQKQVDTSPASRWEWNLHAAMLSYRSWLEKR